MGGKISVMTVGTRRRRVAVAAVALAGAGLSGCMSVGASPSKQQADLKPADNTAAPAQPAGTPTAWRTDAGQHGGHGGSLSADVVPPGATPPAAGPGGAPVPVPSAPGGDPVQHPSSPPGSSHADGPSAPGVSPSAQPSRSGSSAPTALLGPGGIVIGLHL